jgi:two-component system copper resistance phosphate regulon response regulator CusR
VRLPLIIATVALLVVGVLAGPLRCSRVRLRLASHRTPELTVLAHGDLQLDLRTRRAHVDGRTVDLSAREFALVETFLRHPGQVLTREQLLSHV